MSGIVAIGECMLELSATHGAGGWRLGHGGDTFNTALYMTRLGLPVAYLTALGDDMFSGEMRDAWRDEGIDDRLVLTVPGGVPGLYAIRTDRLGERSFTYWRSQAAVRGLFTAPGIEAAIAQAASARLLYVSGITLSLFDLADRARIIALCDRVRGNGGIVAFDPNYRPAGWPDAATARDAMDAIAPFVTIALPTFADEQALYGDSDIAQCGRRWIGAGAREVAIKLGAAGAATMAGDTLRMIAGDAHVMARDTTGAGDAFNAAYLASRMVGRDQDNAARFANRLAAEVVRHPGAIMPRDAMPAFAIDAETMGDCA